MQNVYCYYSSEESDDLHIMIKIGRTDDGQLIATYANGTSIEIKAEDGEYGRGVPVLSFDVRDEPFVELNHGPLAIETPADEIEAAFTTWLATPIPAINDGGEPVAISQIIDGNLILVGGTPKYFALPCRMDTRPLCAVWHGEHLFGFCYDQGTPLARTNGKFIAAEVAKVRERLKTLAIRTRGDWQIVAGEGERLGTDTRAITVDTHVKVGIQPVSPMPNDIHAEWMWAKVTKINGDKITATLANNPCMFAIFLNHGDTICFEKRDIYAVERAKEAA